jgi:hypothetical protein
MADDNDESGTGGRIVRLVVLPIVGVLILAAIGGVYMSSDDEEAELKLELFGSTLTYKSVAELRVPISDLGDLGDDYYVDEPRGFAYRLPQGQWGPVQRFTGQQEFLKAKGVVVRGVSESAPTSTPFGDMIQHPHITRFASERTLSVRFRPTAVFETPLGTVPIGQSALKRADLTNEFMVTVFEKDRLTGQDVSLAGLFSIVTSFDPSTTVDRVEATRGIILAGVSFRYRDVVASGDDRDVSVNRALLFTESDTRFYVVEAGFSPEIGDGLSRWDELQAVLESFRIGDEQV